MTPTNKLRWLIRNIPTSITDETGRYGTERVLQQWWVNTAWPVYSFDERGVTEKVPRPEGEWRDVPIEEEK